ncbi:bifunctional adenosylcobinamide kinase/adenosylcobinamide-phosphate guanylyltransferase [Saccharomonospora sp. NPDC046836]|uniref:bifunctional adenosylcobinamide kinase/adenosylcobinamide-phosphate guanylyltransferase n=1 Tax=Saccharomonospora sp. NPDC046836 TaxID=3156921 RepID=UPI0033EFE8AD
MTVSSPTPWRRAATADLRRRLTDLAAGRLEAGAALLRRYGRRVQGNGRTLVLGGVRSGKSRHAEELMAGHRHVLYLATGLPPSADDPEWASRIAAHRARRPPYWRTVETADLTGALREARAPVLIDCLGTWVSRVLDEVGAWQQEDGWQQRVDERLQAFVDTWQATTVPAVAVTNEVGSGVVPGTVSGRIFRDVLGSLNTAVAANSDTVRLVVAGRMLDLR